ncbi:hypothetical protein [Yeosuana marina]|uniref:hypothetical protein n=1 Tax=Yeosuana marina TaxID=1565536 RepID=UPI0030C88CCF
MNIEQTITQIFETKITGFNPQKMGGEKLKFLGIDSIEFVNIIISICKEIGINPGELDGNIISMENTFEEFLVNFNARKNNKK